MKNRKLKYRTAKVLSPVLHKYVELPFFYTDGRKDDELRRVVWTLKNGKAYVMERRNGCWYATEMNYPYDSKSLVYEYTR